MWGDGPAAGQVGGANLYAEADPLGALAARAAGAPGTVLALGLQRAGTGTVRAVKLRRGAPYRAAEAAAAAAAPRVRVQQATFTKGKSERAAGALAPRGGPGGDAVTSTASVGLDKIELSGVGLVLQVYPSRRRKAGRSRARARAATEPRLKVHLKRMRAGAAAGRGGRRLRCT